MWHSMQNTSCFQWRVMLQSAYVTLDHKTSHKGQFFEIEIYIKAE